MDHLSRAQARRLALGAQGFNTARPTGLSDRRQVRKVIATTHLFQIDSVNVLARAHEMPLWSRIGKYRRGVLDAMTHDGELFEYWAHEASLLPVADWPLFQFQMEAAKHGNMWKGVADLQRRSPGVIDRVLQTVRDEGPTVASAFNTPGRRTGPWWDWSETKIALEYLFWTGQLTARRRTNFEREYDLPERMLPASAWNAPPIPEADARRIMLERAARALGVATERDLCDYYRLKPTKSREALASLIEDGTLISMTVEGWDRAAYLHRDARVPPRIRRASLLSPFDPVVWERQRTQRIFEFRYRIEIYTPAHKRQHGYYVLPFLHNDRIVARVDLKADRKAQRLLVPAAFHETHADPGETATALAIELDALRDWLELDDIDVANRGDLARELRRAVSRL